MVKKEKLYDKLMKLIKSLFDENGKIIKRNKKCIKDANQYDNDVINFNDWTSRNIKKSLGKGFDIKFKDDNYCILTIDKEYIAISYGTNDGLFIKPYKLYWRAERFPSTL